MNMETVLLRLRHLTGQTKKLHMRILRRFPTQIKMLMVNGWGDLEVSVCRWGISKMKNTEIIRDTPIPNVMLQ